MHADACTTGRHHLRDLRKRQKRHALEERADLGMLFKLLLVHDGELRRTGHEHRKQIALLMIRILPVEVLPVVLDDSLDGKIVQELLKLLALKPTRALSCSNVSGLRTFMCAVSAASSSVITLASPQ